MKALAQQFESILRDNRVIIRYGEDFWLVSEYGYVGVGNNKNAILLKSYAFSNKVFELFESISSTFKGERHNN